MNYFLTISNTIVEVRYLNNFKKNKNGTKKRAAHIEGFNNPDNNNPYYEAANEKKAKEIIKKD